MPCRDVQLNSWGGRIWQSRHICNGCSASQSEKMRKTSKAVKAPGASEDKGNFEIYVYIMINAVWRQGGW